MNPALALAAVWEEPALFTTDDGPSNHLTSRHLTSRRITSHRVTLLLLCRHRCLTCTSISLNRFLQDSGHMSNLDIVHNLQPLRPRNPSHAVRAGASWWWRWWGLVAMAVAIVVVVMILTPAVTLSATLILNPIPLSVSLPLPPPPLSHVSSTMGAPL